MKLVTLIVGPIGTNCYLVYDEKTKEGLIVDPGFHAERIVEEVCRLNLGKVTIVATHGHFDHITALASVARQTNAPVLIHALDAECLRDPLQARVRALSSFEPYEPDRLLHDHDVVTAGGLQFTVLHTPGHTRGSICLFGEGILLAGDTLFYHECGRVDLPGGSYRQMLQSLDRLSQLPQDVRVYPGHGIPTTIGEERRENPYMKEGMMR